MHLIGSWRPPRSVPPHARDDFAFIELRCSNVVTVLEDRRRKLVYEGIIFDATNQELLADPAFLDRAFGYYTYVLFEKESRTVYCGTDRLGYSPVYYAGERDTLRFSSSLTLLKYELEKVTPNLDAWDEHLALNDILGDKTVVKEIARLRWGRKIRLTADRVDMVDIWSPEVPAFTDKQTYICANNELLMEAIRLTRTCERQRFVMLSGGEDSRRLAIATQRAGLPVTCVTQQVIGKGGVDRDLLIAEAACKSLGLPHIRVPRPCHRDVLNDAIMEDYWLGYEGGQHEWILPLMRRLPRGVLVYDGIIADVTVNGHFFHTYPELLKRFGDLDYCARLVCGSRQSGVESRLISASLFERVRAELAQYPDSPHRLTYYFLLNHTRRSIGSWFALFYLFGHLPALPYSYYPFLIQSLSIEPRHYLQTWMQNECMKEMHAETAAIPSTRNAVPPSYLVDLTTEAREWSRFAPRHFPIRQDAALYLPGLARIRRMHQVMSLVGLRNRADRWSWAPQYLTRFSRFLDWIEDRQAPEFPIKRETTALLEQHFVS
jgi:hypothetical protein